MTQTQSEKQQKMFMKNVKGDQNFKNALIAYGFLSHNGGDFIAKDLKYEKDHYVVKMYKEDINHFKRILHFNNPWNKSQIENSFSYNTRKKHYTSTDRIKHRLNDFPKVLFGDEIGSNCPVEYHNGEFILYDVNGKKLFSSNVRDDVIYFIEKNGT